MFALSPTTLRLA